MDIIELVKKDLDKRAEIGLKKYGERLKPNNGRDALQDAYEEALDLANYLRQAIEERKVPDQCPSCKMGIHDISCPENPVKSLVRTNEECE